MRTFRFLVPSALYSFLLTQQTNAAPIIQDLIPGLDETQVGAVLGASIASGGTMLAGAVQGGMTGSILGPGGAVAGAAAGAAIGGIGGLIINTPVGAAIGAGIGAITDAANGDA
ncbi:hypothetical protein HK102_000138 [Quaeritorhiza haematococci]|nr:hypothetical protein HK102_000138 [Quaeritorhiza haematococci]